MLFLVVVLWVILSAFSVVVVAQHDGRVTLATVMGCLLFAPIAALVALVCLGDDVVLWKSKEKET